jgi:hypothetical protein
MSAHLRTIIGCLVCTLALVAGAQNVSVQRSAYAAGEKRASVRADIPPVAVVAKVQSPAPASQAPVAARPAAAAPSAGSGGASYMIGIGPFVRHVAQSVEHGVVRTAMFFLTWRDPRGEYVIAASRDPYLPEIGAGPVRFGQGVRFDRSDCVGLMAFENMMAARRALAQKAADAEAAQARAQADAARPRESLPVMASHTESTVATAGGVNAPSSDDARAEPSSVAQSAPVNPEVILRFFDTQKDKSDVKVAVPFVMPYQSEPPLVMDSKAKYQQSDGGTGGSDSAK